ncbi:MAG TPA: hypothetical protein VMS37_18160 [Verrucomicrobiae bacterium]|nr:hypothetical protein [Verrucomicrobiae bacterium]
MLELKTPPPIAAFSWVADVGALRISCLRSPPPMRLMMAGGALCSG